MLKHLGFDIEKHMDSYLMLKLVHILSAVVVAGTGIAHPDFRDELRALSMAARSV